MKHGIKLLNLSNSETIPYPLIRIVGTIENPTCDQSTKPTLTLKLNSDHHNETTVLNNKFKILADLFLGENHIQLNFCCESLEMTISYTPNQTPYTVVPLYIICKGHEGNFQAPSHENNSIESACQRITLCSKLLQTVTADKVLEHGLGRKTFHLESPCRVFHSSLNCDEARRMSQCDLWEFLGREIMNSTIGSERRKYLGFLSCTRYCGEKYREEMKSHEELVGITEGYVALGGGGLALFGSACLYTWPEEFSEIIGRFESNLLVDKNKFLDDSCYRNTQGFCFSTTLGAALHELYHTFDLAHTETGIMSRGFDNIHKFFILNTTDDSSAKIMKSFQSNIEFREEFEPDSLSERLRKENMKKELIVTRKFEETDDTVLTKSCAVLLSYHKWFNSENKSVSSILQFDEVNKSIKSTLGVRVIELREDKDEMVVHSWTFEGKVLKFLFQIPQEILSAISCYKSVVLVAEDSAGNLLKKTICP